ncbi:hypothetical protein AKJ48_00945 [candidate division MSBL1 archaeon SCGC-AAA261O19]|uniref:PIN domain-containing protein n=2 Tax=candidate division MSBL1 TaxID=215777 RepID=A0A133VEQ8_9EURY|nr:hypothetical protein AKJ48_00945 [candidate division MSBL1 archaeon SCGC-AAA261O19]
MNLVKYLDASIPLCPIIEKPGEKVEECERIMKSVETGVERVKTSTFTVAEMFHILLHREKLLRKKVGENLNSFLKCAGLRLVDAEKAFCGEAIELSLDRKVDFVDAHHVLTMQKLGIKEIYSLDPHFDGFRNIDRFEAIEL